MDQDSPTGVTGFRQSSQSGSHHGITNNISREVATSNTPLLQSHSSQVTQLSITQDRIIARTPPSGGRMGTVGSGSPGDHMITLQCTPQSVPHPIYTPVL